MVGMNIGDIFVNLVIIIFIIGFGVCFDGNKFWNLVNKRKFCYGYVMNMKVIFW